MSRPTLLRRETAADRGPAARAGMLILAALLMLPQVALPATIVVDNAGCTLVDAIEAANTDLPVAGCVAGDPGADTIELTADVTLTGVETYFAGPTGTPVVSSEITVDGAGFTVERADLDGVPEFRIFTVNPSGTLTLSDVTVSNGDAGYYYYSGDADDAPGTGAAGRRGAPEGYYYVAYDGGGVLNRGGTLTISNSTVTGNRTNSYYYESREGYYGGSGRGGGIASRAGAEEGYGGSIDVTGSVVSDNYAGGQGGGIFAANPLTITNSTISGNSADGDGGGVQAQQSYYYSEASSGMAPLIIANSTISGNTSDDDGGGVDASTAVEVSYSTFDDNVANDDGGGMRINGYGASTIGNTTFSNNRAGYGPGEGGDGRGGGLNARTRSYYGPPVEGYEPAELTITNSTFSGNTAYSGGGMFTRHYNYGGSGPEGEETPPATLRNVTFSGNEVYYGGKGPGKGSGVKGGLGSGAGEGGYYSGGASILAQGYGGYGEGDGYGAILENTILGFGFGDDHCRGDIGDGGGNLDDDGSCGGGFGALAGLDPMLADNGGPTQTHALLAGSTAIDAAGDCGLAIDQRGFPRDALCDSGAFEGGVEEFTCDDIRDLNALILATDPGEFVFPSYRIIMGYITQAAARNCDIENIRNVVSLLGRIVERTDGNPAVPDWMHCGMGIVCPRDEIHDFALAIQEYFKTLLP